MKVFSYVVVEFFKNMKVDKNMCRLFLSKA